MDVNRPGTRELEDLRSVAEMYAKAAGIFLRDRRGEVLEVEIKSHKLDLVTQVDRESEKLIVRGIQQLRPDDGFVGEEGTKIEGTSGVDWIIDPLDGTFNYRRGGQNRSAASIGAEFNGEPIVGAVFDVLANSLYSAANGLGATRDGREISVSGLQEFDEALIVFDGPLSFVPKDHHLKIYNALWQQVAAVRQQGCSALDYCYVADGTFDGAFGHMNQDWDIAAGMVIAQEAGARIGSSTSNVPKASDNMAATPAIFDQLQKVIASVGPLQI